MENGTVSMSDFHISIQKLLGMLQNWVTITGGFIIIKIPASEKGAQCYQVLLTSVG